MNLYYFCLTNPNGLIKKIECRVTLINIFNNSVCYLFQTE